MVRIVLVLACFGLAILPIRAFTDAKDPVAEIRAKYLKQSAEPLDIVEPIKISNVYYWKDGGSIGIKIIDAKEKNHLFSLDGRMLPTADHPKEPGTRNLYVGAEHPSRPGARKVNLGGPEETALYGVMLRWATNHPQREALFTEEKNLQRPKFGNLCEVREFFLKLDRRFTKK